MKKLRFQIKKILILSMVVINLLPFFIHDVYADDYSGSTIQGFNVSLIDVEQTLVNSSGTSGYMSKYIYEVEFILDDSYVGYINISGEIKFYPYNSSTLTTYSLSGRNYFVNGTSFKLTFQLTGDGYTADNRPSLNNTIFTYGNHNLYKHSEIDSLETIIDLLTDLYNNTDTIEGLLNSQLTQLQLIAQRCNISNQYLEILSNTKQWNIPFESIAPTISMLKNGFEIYEVKQYNNFQFPIFVVHPDDVIYRFASAPTNVSNRYDDYNVIILWNKAPSDSTMNNMMKTIDGTWSNASNRLYEWYDGSYNWCITKFKLNNFTKSSVYNSITNKYNTDIYLSIIYFAPDESEELVSTDFALNFGLNNKLLNNLNIIANGTTQSNQSASNLEQSNTNLETSQNQMFSFENQQNQNMNNALNQIDTNFNIGNVFGSSFLASADWVRTQFNLMTAGNAFGSVLSFSLLLGLSLLIIGKVLG